MERPENARTLTHLTFRRSRGLCQMLAGHQSLPAATVVADSMDRSAVTCIWLTQPEAAATPGALPGGTSPAASACVLGDVESGDVRSDPRDTAAAGC